MAQKYNLPDAYKGDTYDDIQFTITINDVALDLTGSTIRCQFKKEKKTGALKKTITNTGGITVTDAVNGVFKIDAFVLDWDEGDYYYDIKITSATDVVTTYLQGTLNVNQNVTN